MSHIRRVGLHVALLLSVAGCKDAVLGPGDAMQFSQVSAGPTHACAVGVDGKAYCWGSGELGELGNAPARSSNVPVTVPGAFVFSSVGAGYSHSCGLTASGDIYCWGWGILGQLGNGNFGASPPVKVVGEHHFVAVSAGWDHTCAIGEGYAVYCWGSNGNGQLGDGTFTNRAAPVKVQSTEQFAFVSAGARHTCALTGRGIAFCWGGNDLGQLGSAEQGDATTPRAVAGGLIFAAISAGVGHSCGVANGETFCWGSDEFGELGNRTVGRPGLPGSRLPVIVAQDAVGSPSMARVSAGDGYTCAVAVGGASYCWGRGQQGQLGGGNFEDSPVPHAMAGPAGPNGPDVQSFAAVSAGGLAYACGLTLQNAAFCWGRGEHGELGPATTSSAVPVRVSGGN